VQTRLVKHAVCISTPLNKFIDICSICTSTCSKTCFSHSYTRYVRRHSASGHLSSGRHNNTHRQAADPQLLCEGVPDLSCSAAAHTSQISFFRRCFLKFCNCCESYLPAPHCFEQWLHVYSVISRPLRPSCWQSLQIKVFLLNTSLMKS